MKKNIFIISVSFVIFFLISNSISAVTQSSSSVNIGGDSYYSFYDLNDDSFTFRLATDVSSANNDYKSYFVNPNNWLEIKKCIVNLNSNYLSANFNNSLNVDLNKNLVLGSSYYNISSIISNDILDRNYYMKTFIKAELIDSSDDSLKTIIYPTNLINNQYTYRTTGITYDNYTLAKPSQVFLNFNFLNKNQINSTYGYGRYYWKITAIPIDGKCDFDNSGNLNLDEVQSSTIYYNETTFSNSIITFDIFKDEDGDGWSEDGSNLGKGNDLCPNDLTGSEDEYRGCLSKYKSNYCIGSMKYNESEDELYCNSDLLKFDNNFNCNSGDISSCGWIDIGNVNYKWNFLLTYTLIPSKPNRGTGRYLCVKDNSLPWENEEIKGYCDLRFNAELNCTDSLTGITLKSGENEDFYKYPILLPSEKSLDLIKKEVSCRPDGSFLNEDFSNFKFTNPIILNPDYNDFQRLSDGSISKNDEVSQGKISCKTFNPENNDCSILIDDENIPINLPILSSNPKTIKIYKQGVLVRNDTIDSKLIAMSVQDIKLFSSKTEIENYVNKSYILMNQFDIEKHLNYDSVSNRTTVTLKLKNVPDSDKTNLTIYQIISKDDVDNFDNIEFIDNGNGESIIQDKDPVIGWYFDESETDEEVSYSVPGESEGGTIIITQDPILLNEGELIINYRESGCNADETPLFDLDSLEYSNLYLPESGELYTVCITHRNSTIAATISNDDLSSSTKDLNVLSFDSLASINYSKLTNKVHLSTTEDNLYWDLLIQKDNPTGNYSCIGSFDDGYETSNVTFGDCGFKENNRLWIHLGADYYPPTTTLTIPYLSHSTKVVLDVEDNIGGSGVKNSSYRIDDDIWINYSKHTEFTLTCPEDSSCKHKIEYKSSDFEGNIENKTYTLNVLEKASACESSCLSKPSPDRYLKECRNLNGCKYYPINNSGNYDDGVYVANQCDFQLKGSKVYYNETHDITCPNGPLIRVTRSNEQFNPLESYCDSIKTTSYPVILNGEQVLLDVISCIDPYKNLN